MRGQADRGTGWRADGKHASVRNPTPMRVKVTPLGPTALSASAMKRNDAPQIVPGTASSSQPVASVCAVEMDTAVSRVDASLP